MIPVQYRISTSQNIPLVSHVQTALESGCQWIQLQTNGESGPTWIKTITQIKDLCREHEATFIIEDNIDLVKTIDGDGIHITDQTPVSEIRQQIGEGFLIGANANNAEDIVRMKQQSADYICYGPFSKTVATAEENDLESIQNIQGLVHDIEEKDVFLPICAFGKISVEDALPILHTGLRGISIKIEEEQINESLVSSTLERFLKI